MWFRNSSKNLAATIRYNRLRYEMTKQMHTIHPDPRGSE